MKLSVDTKTDALYLRLDDSNIVESEEVRDGVFLDFNESDEVVGIELHRLSERSPHLNLTSLQFETV